MVKRIVLFGILAMLVWSLVAAESGFTSESVLAVESVWMSESAAQAGDFDLGFFHSMIDYYIKVPSFNYQVMPKADVDEFQASARSLKSVNSKNMTEAMDQTVIPMILKVLSDPDIQKARLDEARDTVSTELLVKQKAELYGLSNVLISQLLDAGYLYLPYISNIQKSYRKSTHKYTVEGGILWYRIHINADGVARLIFRQADAATGKGRSDANKPKVFSTFRHGEQVIQTTPEQYAKYYAVRILLENLRLQMRKNPEFALGARINERLPHKMFSAKIGRREGVHLDDKFHIVQFSEDSDGNLSQTKIGFARIVNTADNRTLEKSDANSLAQAYYCNGNSETAYLREQKSTGLDMNISAGSRFGLDVPKAAGIVNPTTSLLDKDISKAFVLDAGFHYNMAPIWGIKQLFIDLEFAYSLPIADYTTSSKSTSSHIATLYTGLSKKIWFGRNAVTFFGKGGFDSFAAKAKQDDKKLSLSATSMGAKLGLNYTYLLSPKWMFNVDLDHKFGTAPIASSLKYDGNKISVSGSLKDAHKDINLGGTQVKIGLSRSLELNPFNIGRWLNKYKKH
ncbi:MAG: hypothetical protein PHY48_04020 [Candidatus Cloacimonetes bacterium]|nr:hypothetical protein [Candidatus Cloacimonadota bacterium]